MNDPQHVNGHANGNRAVAEIQTEDEALKVLLDADIDNVMAGLDHIVEAAPSYRKLFSRWENQQWSTEQFDFTVDKQQWQETDLLGDQMARDQFQWSLSAFFLGEERVTTELLPFAIAAPDDDQRVFLATQISDEAKHAMFFDRFYREVFETDAQTLTANLAAQRPKMTDNYLALFDGILHDCAETLRKDPSDFKALVRGITVYMLVIEGTLALTGARFMIRSLKQDDLLPGFRQGFTAVNRDESRHVGFGVKFLADAVKDDPSNRQVIADTLKETLPVATLALSPPMYDDPYNWVSPLGFTSQDMFGYAFKSLRKKLSAIGIEPETVAVAA